MASACLADTTKTYGINMLEWSEHYDSYWFDSADLYARKSWWPRRCQHTGESLWLKPFTQGFNHKDSPVWWPRRCQHTGESLWLKPCVKGQTMYFMRSGTKRYDVRWISERFFIEQKLKRKGT